MYHISATVGTSANWKPELMAAVNTAVTNQSWTVTENAYADGTYTRWVFKAASNDFYVVFFCVTANLNIASNYVSYSNSAALYWTICEEYDAGTHLMSKVAVFNNATRSFTADATDTTCTYAATYTIAALVAAGTAGPGFGYFHTAASSGPVPIYPTAYVISVWSDNLSIGTKNAYNGLTPAWWVNQVASFGNFDSQVTVPGTNDPKPIGVIAGTCYSNSSLSGAVSTTTNQSAVCRSPMNGAEPAHVWNVMAQSEIAEQYVISSPKVGSTFWDKWQGASGPTFSRVSLVRMANDGRGYLRGTAKYLISGVGDAVFGDTVTIGTATYFCTGAPYSNSGNATPGNSTFWIRSN